MLSRRQASGFFALASALLVAAALALALALTLMNPGSATAGDGALVAVPNADGSYTIRESRTGAGWGWSGRLPDGRQYTVLAEPSAGSPWAYVRIEGDPQTVWWVPAAAVCPDADWLMRVSAACR